MCYGGCDCHRCMGEPITPMTRKELMEQGGTDILMRDLTKAGQEIADLREKVAHLEKLIVIADNTGRMDPYWKTATPKDVLDAFEFQGAMTRVLLEETDERRETIKKLEAEILQLKGEI